MQKNIDLSEFGYNSNVFESERQANQAYNNIISSAQNKKKLADLIRKTCGIPTIDRTKKIKIDFEVTYHEHNSYSQNQNSLYSSTTIDCSYSGYYIYSLDNTLAKYQATLGSGTQTEQAGPPSKTYSYKFKDGLRYNKQDNWMLGQYGGTVAYLEGVKLDKDCKNWIIQLGTPMSFYLVDKDNNVLTSELYVPNDLLFLFNQWSKNPHVTNIKYKQAIIKRTKDQTYPQGNCEQSLSFSYSLTEKLAQDYEYTNSASFSCVKRFRLSLYEDGSSSLTTTNLIDNQIINELNF